MTRESKETRDQREGMDNLEFQVLLVYLATEESQEREEQGD